MPPKGQAILSPEQQDTLLGAFILVFRSPGVPACVKGQIGNKEFGTIQTGAVGSSSTTAYSNHVLD